MSVIEPQQQPQQQPVVIYNNTPTHYSDGSFGTVFVVLAIIIVISTIACFLGRLCNKRLDKQNPKQTHNFQPSDGDVEFGNRDNFQPKEARPKEGGHNSFRPNPKDGDTEIGSDKKVPSLKLNGKNGQRKDGDANNGPKAGANGA